MIHVDFETFSTAGYVWSPVKERWGPLEGTKTSGLPAIGVEVYARHPSTRVVCAAFDGRIWWPGDPPPLPIWEHVRNGGLFSAWNSQFEWWIWNEVLHGWPELPLAQIVDVMPRARAWSMPGGLGNCAKIMGIDAQKDTEGKGLMRKFSMPRSPTKYDKGLVWYPRDSPEDAAAYGRYCLQDVAVEASLSRVLPELSPFETRVWELDQRINVRGIPVDVEAVENAAELLRQSERVLNARLCEITDGEVSVHSQLAKLQGWCYAWGANLPDMTAPTIVAALDRDDLRPEVRRALEIRQALSSVSTKKVWAFRNRASRGRIHGQFVYCGADRTGRWSGYGIQPHNFPRGSSDWSPEKTDGFIADMKCRDYRALAARWGDPLKALSSSLRGLIKTSPGHRFIGADYSAIEAVVLAVLAGEQWRVDVFKGHGMIYESSATKITGMQLSEYVAYKAREGKHHPDRALGKLAELASGYGGSVGAWRKFGADKYFTPERCEECRDEWDSDCAFKQRVTGRPTDTLQDFAIRKQVRAWREASPNIAAFWKGLESAAIAAVRTPGTCYTYRDISYVVEHGTLYCKLPSGRRLAYHQAHLVPGKFGGDAVAYFAWNTNPKFGGRGWVRLDTYGGKLTENAVQAISRDILAHGMLNAEAAGYAIVMHVHDEIVCEEPYGFGSVDGLIRCMLDLPPWAKGWPLKADGWSGERFRK